MKNLCDYMSVIKQNFFSIFFFFWLYSRLELGRIFFGFLIPFTVSMTPWMEDQPVARPLPTHIHVSSGILIHELQCSSLNDKDSHILSDSYN
jgi:hypothetical protein